MRLERLRGRSFAPFHRPAGGRVDLLAPSHPLAPSHRLDLTNGQSVGVLSSCHYICAFKARHEHCREARAPLAGEAAAELRAILFTLAAAAARVHRAPPPWAPAPPRSKPSFAALSASVRLDTRRKVLRLAVEVGSLGGDAAGGAQLGSTGCCRRRSSWRARAGQRRTTSGTRATRVYRAPAGPDAAAFGVADDHVAHGARLGAALAAHLLPQGHVAIAGAPLHRGAPARNVHELVIGGAMPVFATRSLLGALGVANRGAAEGAAAINWFSIKDGAGRLGRVLFARWGASSTASWSSSGSRATR
jgi:hypothetical protein